MAHKYCHTCGETYGGDLDACPYCNDEIDDDDIEDPKVSDGINLEEVDDLDELDELDDDDIFDEEYDDDIDEFDDEFDDDFDDSLDDLGEYFDNEYGIYN